jgi:hypothetical protein
MTRFLADEDFNNDILRGLLRRHADLEVVRVQDVGLVGAEDDAVLKAAAAEGRVLLTHDVSTLIGKHSSGSELDSRCPASSPSHSRCQSEQRSRSSCSSLNAARRRNGRTRSGTCRYANHVAVILVCPPGLFDERC